MRVFLAGASGAVGRCLVPLLVAAGHEVTGMTRSPERAARLEQAGARGVVVDAYDRAGLIEAVRQARPDVVMHQLTDLTRDGGATPMEELMQRNSRVRIEGTRNLLAAARAAGARRFVAQSICFIYAPGSEPHLESDPLDGGDNPSPTVAAVMSLEATTLSDPSIEGLVLRYGRFYGPGTWNEAPSGRGPVHVEAAAQAALLATDRGEPGIYNIAEDDGYVSIEKARRQLGWDPAFRMRASGGATEQRTSDGGAA